MKRPRWVDFEWPILLDSEGRLFELDTERTLTRLPDPPPIASDDAGPPIVPEQGPGDIGEV